MDDYRLGWKNRKLKSLVRMNTLTSVDMTLA